MNKPSVYKNIYRMPIHVPFGDINGGHMTVEDGVLVIDYYGDGQSVDRFADFDPNTVSKILNDWQEAQRA